MNYLNIFLTCTPPANTIIRPRGPGAAVQGACLRRDGHCSEQDGCGGSQAPPFQTSLGFCCPCLKKLLSNDFYDFSPGTSCRSLISSYKLWMSNLSHRRAKIVFSNFTTISDSSTKFCETSDPTIFHPLNR